MLLDLQDALAGPIRRARKFVKGVFHLESGVVRRETEVALISRVHTRPAIVATPPARTFRVGAATTGRIFYDPDAHWKQGHRRQTDELELLLVTEDDDDLILLRVNDLDRHLRRRPPGTVVVTAEASGEVGVHADVS